MSVVKAPSSAVRSDRRGARTEAQSPVLECPVELGPAHRADVLADLLGAGLGVAGGDLAWRLRFRGALDRLWRRVGDDLRGPEEVRPLPLGRRQPLGELR